jgi:acyl-CoA synthetase (AMP-forming)/AMP-acid ligase II
MIRIGFRQTEQSIILNWLPLYHDMGLIGNVLQALYLGAPCILMSPSSFLQKPVRWLQAISRYKATSSGGPNFAYQLCTRKILPEQRRGLELSSWNTAFNGAEPICHETLERFATAFEPYGFRREVFYPCYGLAEATLLVAAARDAERPALQVVQSSQLKKNRVVSKQTKMGEDTSVIVSCGRTLLGQKILIVDPESMTRCPPDRVGEIWVSGPSVARGYFNQPDETEVNFKAHLADTGEGPFLRTGDLGFFKNGELFVTGRLKDLIIIAGRNHYPQDIEYTVEESHPLLKPCGSAAFSVEVAGEERLAIVAEIEGYRGLERIKQTGKTVRGPEHLPGLDARAVQQAVRKAVAQHHEIQVYALMLLKAGTLPKTTSGKVQRHACRDAFVKKTLEEFRGEASHE